MILNNPDKNWDWRDISCNKFDKPKYITKIQKWYKRMKLLSKLWSGIEIMIQEQMKPNGKYMQNFIINELK